MSTAAQTETKDAGQETKLYCTVHPEVETTLRCNRCGRPMCTRCAVRTPVGYRCKECVRAQQDRFFDAQMRDYLVAAAASLVLSFLAAGIVAQLGWFYFAFFLAPAAGSGIGAAVWKLTGKRRGRYTALIVGSAVVLGALPFLPGHLFAIGIYLALATSTAVARFQLRL